RLQRGQADGADGQQVAAGPVLAEQQEQGGGPGAERLAAVGGGLAVVGGRHGPPGGEQGQRGGVGAGDHPAGERDQPVDAGQVGEALGAVPAALGEVVGGDLVRRDGAAGQLPAVADGVGGQEAECGGDHLGRYVAQRATAAGDVKGPTGESELTGA